MKELYDCSVIGGGPSGLTAALTLVRAKRRIIIFDSSNGRNSSSAHSHNYLTRDGTSTHEMKELGKAEILRYSTANFKNAQVNKITKNQDVFQLITDDGVYNTKKIIFATGARDVFPTIDGFDQFWGKSLFSCPYCDAYEFSDKPIIIISENPSLLYSFSKKMLNWTKDIVVCTNGKKALTDKQRESLLQRGYKISDQEVKCLKGCNGALERVEFMDGTSVKVCGGVMAPTRVEPGSTLPASLGCSMNAFGITTDVLGKTNVGGVFAAGDNVHSHLSQVSIACASGSKAAIGVNTELSEEEFNLYRVSKL
ncbi:hypothetical protein AKO1_010421 [Acrasis kona]|uniref:FAD/NAD(P)-binding domain-containing protein n=1 Tax=Acrasis kona TaxID=1008807 RepID=A0AAW2ZI42_9EUKA